MASATVNIANKIGCSTIKPLSYPMSPIMNGNTAQPPMDNAAGNPMTRDMQGLGNYSSMCRVIGAHDK